MYSLLKHNTFGIEASCRDFFEYDSVSQLQEKLPQLAGSPWMHIGGGSNLLFVHDYEGTVLHSRIRGVEELKRDASHVWLRAGAGTDWDGFVEHCVRNGFHGLENLSLIPGEVGASAVQNIGAYGIEVARFIDQVETVEAATGKIRIFSAAECQYAYRSSVFKHSLRGRFIVTHVVYRLDLQFSPDVHYGAIAHELERRGWQPEKLTAAQLRQVVIDIRRAKLPDPSEMGSAGSFFMNPVISQEDFDKLQASWPEVPHYVLTDGVKVPAGWLIEQCGWKGRHLGRAGVYPLQALVLVNLGGATGAEIWKLAETIQTDVYAKFGIKIQPEANII